ncbi:hypothetical protein CR513_40428, partial [Mucuna pruriens]
MGPKILKQNAIKVKLQAYSWCIIKSPMIDLFPLESNLPSSTLNHKSSYELLHHHPVTFLDLKVFGCLVYSSTLTHHITKLDSWSRKAIFL